MIDVFKTDALVPTAPDTVGLPAVITGEIRVLLPSGAVTYNIIAYPVCPEKGTK